MKFNIFKKRQDSDLKSNAVEPNNDQSMFDLQSALTQSRRRTSILASCKEMLEIVNIEGVDHLQYFKSESGIAGAASIDGSPTVLHSLWAERAESIINLIQESISVETSRPRPQQGPKTVTAFEIDRKGHFVFSQRVEEMYNESQVTVKGLLGDSANYSHEFEFDYDLASVARAEVRRIGKANYDHVCMSEAQRANLKSRMSM